MLNVSSLGTLESLSILNNFTCGKERLWGRGSLRYANMGLSLFTKNDLMVGKGREQMTSNHYWSTIEVV